jgi:predicted AAA+ superfamily ATPase
MENREKIRQYLVDFQERKMETFARELNVRFTREFIVSIVGARRVGKTSLIFNLISRLKDRKEILYVDFDYPEFLDFDGKNIKDLVDLHLQMFGKLRYIFFDEIQNIENWEKGLRQIYEMKKYFIFVTGSSAKLLSKELATQLRGRTVAYHLFPLSFRELLSINGVDFSKKFLTSEDKNRILFQFNDYFNNGGYPQIVMEKGIKELIIRDYKDLVLFRDLVERYSLKNIYVIKRFFEYLIESFAKEISIDKFYNFLKSQNVSLSKKTLYNYIEYFGSSLFFHFLRSHRIKERLKKVYLNDIVFGGADKGRRLENMVYLELARANKIPFYYKGANECDFIIPKKEAIQVVWELNSENEKREIAGLEECMNYFKIKNGLILTCNQEKIIKRKNFAIKVMPFWKWCLGINYAG